MQARSRSCRSRRRSARASRSRWRRRRRSTTSTSRCRRSRRSWASATSSRTSCTELEEQLKKKKLSQGGAGQGQEGAQEAADDVADVGRGDGRAQLHRLGARAAVGREDRGQAATSSRRSGSSTRTTTASRRSRSASSSTSPCRRWWRSSRARSSASSARRASARRRSARSIAHATGRKFVRLSLGGVRDEAEIRGHRRTYIGALPGKIIQSLKKAGSQQPGLPARRDRQDVDRLPRRSVGGAARGARPRAEQHLQRSLPRSRLRPVATSCSSRRRTTLHAIPLPLQDRMEIIQLPGYTELEKVAIAEQYLIPKQKRGQRRRGRRRSTFTEDAIRDDHPPLHEGGGRP